MFLIFVVVIGGVDLELVNVRKVEFKVDKKKFEKVERKIVVKQSKKIYKMVEYEVLCFFN